MELFDELKVGSQVLSREYISSVYWDKITVTKIEGDYITFEDDDGMEIDSNRGEVNGDIYFRRVGK